MYVYTIRISTQKRQPEEVEKKKARSVKECGKTGKGKGGKGKKGRSSTNLDHGLVNPWLRFEFEVHSIAELGFWVF